MTILSKEDVDLIAEWRAEMLTNRMRPISVIYEKVERDPIGGDIIDKSKHVREVSAVVTELSLGSRTGSRNMENGIIYEEGDAKFDIDIEDIEDIADDITQIDYDDILYEIKAIDKKGMGRRNRFEILGRVIS